MRVKFTVDSARDPCDRKGQELISRVKMGGAEPAVAGK
jgi:hypothetical protein